MFKSCIFQLLVKKKHWKIKPNPRGEQGDRSHCGHTRKSSGKWFLLLCVEGKLWAVCTFSFLRTEGIACPLAQWESCTSCLSIFFSISASVKRKRLTGTCRKAALKINIYFNVLEMFLKTALMDSSNPIHWQSAWAPFFYVCKWQSWQSKVTVIVPIIITSYLVISKCVFKYIFQYIYFIRFRNCLRVYS